VEGSREWEQPTMGRPPALGVGRGDKLRKVEDLGIPVVLLWIQ